MSIKNDYYTPNVTAEEIEEVSKIGLELMREIDQEMIDFILSLADNLHQQGEQLGVRDGILSGIFHAGMLCERNRALKLAKMRGTKNA